MSTFFQKWRNFIHLEECWYSLINICKCSANEIPLFRYSSISIQLVNLTEFHLLNKIIEPSREPRRTILLQNFLTRLFNNFLPSCCSFVSQKRREKNRSSKITKAILDILTSLVSSTQSKQQIIGKKRKRNLPITSGNFHSSRRRSFRDDNQRRDNVQWKQRKWMVVGREGEKERGIWMAAAAFSEVVASPILFTRLQTLEAKVFEVGLKLAYHREPGWRECLPDTVSSTHSRVIRWNLWSTATRGGCESNPFAQPNSSLIERISSLPLPLPPPLSLCGEFHRRPIFRSRTELLHAKNVFERGYVSRDNPPFVEESTLMKIVENGNFYVVFFFFFFFWSVTIGDGIDFLAFEFLLVVVLGTRSIEIEFLY